jgi:sedoheptulose-bisphosphatase
MYDKLMDAGTVSTVSSTEEPYEIPVEGKGFAVAFDPLDSTPSVDVNFAVGASWGVWNGSKLTGVTGRDMAAAGLVMYGPRTTMLVATAGAEGVMEFVLTNSATGEWEWLQSNIFSKIDEDQPFRRAIFAPGNLRATASSPGYRKLVDFYLDSRYHLRYSGGMVPDVCQLVVKGVGIFTNADGGDSAPARLRLLYEAAPAAFIVEKAGGASSDGERSILDVLIADTDQRTQVAVGSKAEVARFDRIVGPCASGQGDEGDGFSSRS